MYGSPAKDVQFGRLCSQGQHVVAVLDKDHTLLADLLNNAAGTLNHFFGNFRLGGVQHTGNDALHGAVADQVDDHDDSQQEGQHRCPADHMAGTLLGHPVGCDEQYDQQTDSDQESGNIGSAFLQIGFHLAGFGSHLVKDRGQYCHQRFDQFAALFFGLNFVGLGFRLSFGLSRFGCFRFGFGLSRFGGFRFGSLGFTFARRSIRSALCGTGFRSCRYRAAVSRRLFGRLGFYRAFHGLSLMELDAGGGFQRFDLVGLGADVVDDTGPVETKAKVILVAVGIFVAFAVTGHVLFLLLNSIHGGGLLVVQQTGGLHLTAQDVQQGFGIEPLAVEACAAVAQEDHVGRRLDLTPDHGASCLHQHHDFAGLGHGCFNVLEHLQIGIVGSAGSCLLGIGTVDVDSLAHHAVTVILGNSLLVGGDRLGAGFLGFVFVILDGSRQVGIVAQVFVRTVDFAVGSGSGHRHQGQVTDSQLLGRGTDNIVLGIGGIAFLIRLAAWLAQCVGHHVVVFLDHFQIHGRFPGSRIAGRGGVALGCSRELPRYIDRQHLFFLTGLVDSVAIVLEHDDALFLHGQREFFGIAVVVDSLGGLQLDVGVLVQAALELGQQEVIGGVAQNLQRLVLSQLILHKLKAVGSSVQIRGTAHLVDAVHVELGKTLGNCQVLYAEGLGAVDGDLPVGENKALVVVLPQQADFVLGIGPADPLAQFMVALIGDGVVGHDAGFMGNALGQVEGTVKERDQMGSKVIAGKYIELAAVAVIIAAALSGAGTHIVLGDSVDGVNAPAQVGTILSPGALQSGDVSIGQVAAQSRVLGISACRAGQNRGRADIDLGSQQHGDADGTIHFAVSNTQRKGCVHIKSGA